MFQRRSAIAALLHGMLVLTAESLYAQPAPLSARTGGMLVGDSTLQRVYRVQDLNGDNNGNDPGEATSDVLDTGAGNLLTAGIGGAGTAAQGGITYSTVNITLSAAASPPPAPCTITVQCTDLAGNGSDDCPHVVSVSGSGTGPYQLTLSGVIPPRECTILTIFGVDPAQRLQYQSLPGDADLGGSVNTQDLLALVQAINSGAANLPVNLARYNIDRSSGASPVNTQDLLREVQLLNGVNTIQVFDGATVAPCP